MISVRFFLALSDHRVVPEFPSQLLLEPANMEVARTSQAARRDKQSQIPTDTCVIARTLQ